MSHAGWPCAHNPFHVFARRLSYGCNEKQNEHRHDLCQQTLQWKTTIHSYTVVHNNILKIITNRSVCYFFILRIRWIQCSSSAVSNGEIDLFEIQSSSRRFLWLVFCYSITLFRTTRVPNQIYVFAILKLRLLANKKPPHFHWLPYSRGIDCGAGLMPFPSFFLLDRLLLEDSLALFLLPTSTETLFTCSFPSSWCWRCVKKWPTGTRSWPKPTDAAARTLASRISLTWPAFWLLKLWLSFLQFLPIIRPSSWGT